jgi:hypothetical protein
VSGFLAGIALRGAGLYPAARARQPRSGLADSGIHEITSEMAAVPEAESPEIAAVRPSIPAGGSVTRVESYRRETSLKEIVHQGTGGEVTLDREPAKLPLDEIPREEPLEKSARVAAAERIVHDLRTADVDPLDRALPEQVTILRDFPHKSADSAGLSAGSASDDRPVVLRNLPLRPAIKQPAMLMPLSPKVEAGTQPDPEPRPVEIRIGRVEVRAAASPTKAQPAAPRPAAAGETGFRSYIRMRTYRNRVL